MHVLLNISWWFQPDLAIFACGISDNLNYIGKTVEFDTWVKCVYKLNVVRPLETLDFSPPFINV